MLKTIIRPTTLNRNLLRNIHTSSVSRLREIYVEKKDDKTTVVGAKIVNSPRVPYLLKYDEKSDKCPLCQLKLNLKYTDVLILNQYLNSKGEIMPKEYTKLCKDQYKLVTELIYMAQYAGLLPEPPRDKKPYNLLNTYYDEKTIDLNPEEKKHVTKFNKLKLGPIERLRVKPDIGFYFGKKYE